MEKNNILYKNQGIHTICSIFTIDKGEVKVLLIKRKNNPYNGMWALVGGALYNNEEVEDGLNREIKEKTGLSDIRTIHSGIFSSPDRSPIMRMVALSYVGIIDFSRVQLLTDTIKTSDAQWFSLYEVPKLAYDHNKILQKGIETLKEKIIDSDILESFYPNGFTLPELHIMYETILGKKIDRRNFRKKLLNDGIIVETGDLIKFNGKKPAALYKINREKRGVVL